MQRRLVAILISDVVGCVRLIQADEEGRARPFPSDLYDVFAPAIAMHPARLVKTTGDGLLVEFQSVLDAVRCAIEIRRNKAAFKTHVPIDTRHEYVLGLD